MTYDENLIIEAIYRPEGEQGSEDAGWEIDLRFTPEDSEGHWVGVTDESLSVIVGENLARALIADRDRQAAEGTDEADKAAVERLITFRRAEWSDEGHTPEEIDAMEREEREAIAAKASA